MTSRRPIARRAARLARVALLAFAVLLALTAADAALLSGRVTRVDVDGHPGPGTTWVLVGTDSREHLPAGATAEQFGTTADVPGSRADVVLVVHIPDAGATTVLAVPRDLVVGSRRLTLTWLDGPQATLDALCELGIPSDHLVSVDLRGFTDVVDAAGGLRLHVPAAVRDPMAGLELPSAGPRHVDGDTALALVRSRHPERLVDDRWVPMAPDPDGRPAMAATVLEALSDAVRTRPWRLQSVAWAGTGTLTLGEETTPADLVQLLTADLADPVVVPAGQPVDGGWARFPTAETAATVEAAELSCGG